MKPITLRSLIQFIVFLFLFERCAYNDLNDLKSKVDCTASTLSLKLVSSVDVTSCRAIDGKITVTAEGGVAPYDFSLSGGIYQTGTEFTNLAPGTYTVQVKDANGCSRSIDVTVASVGSNLDASYSATADNQCFSNNGTVTISATGGNTPYSYQIDSKGFFASNAFSGLTSGQHSVIIRDANDCQRVISVQVPRGATGISYTTDIKPILQTQCALSGCHGANSSNGDWTNLNTVKEKAVLIKSRTGNKSMPIGGGSLSQQQIDQIACWVDDGAPSN